MSANKADHSGGHLKGVILLPETPLVNVVGGDKAAFLVDGKNYDEEGSLTRSLTKRNTLEPGAWRIEISPMNDTGETIFLVVLLPSSLTSSPTHRVRRLEEAGRFGCEITGPSRTTRWWFEPGRNGVDIEVITGIESTNAIVNRFDRF